MSAFIVGTAGHIDHGKSALVQALTGTDPDRLKEERERGITIELGFAHATLPDGSSISFIDVPGHERFVRHMLAGAHGVDAVILVIAADESVMPQTREHFHICRLLGIEQGLIALTKCDLVDDDTLAMVRHETEALVAGSFLDGAAVVPFSARTGQGKDALTEELQRLATRRARRASAGVLRLPVDRVFTLRGFGTVVTGTLVSGELDEGQDVEILPSGRVARVRGLQIHGQVTKKALAGNRTAVNLAGVEVSDVVRGEVLTTPGTLVATLLLDARVSLLPEARPLRPRARVRVHAGSAEALGRFVPLDGATLEPGGSVLAQIRLETPLVVCAGDLIVLRSYSPLETIGGARVLDALTQRWRRPGAAVRARLKALEGAGTTEAAAIFVKEAGPSGISLTHLAARVAVPAGEVGQRLRGQADVVLWGREDSHAVDATAFAELQTRAMSQIAAFHEEQPQEPAMSRDELRRRAMPRVPEGLAGAVLDALERAGAIRLDADRVSLPGYRPRFSSEEDRLRESIRDAASEAGLTGLERHLLRELCPDERLCQRVVRTLVSEGSLDRVGGTLLVARDALRRLEEDVRQRWPSGSSLDVGAVKTLTGLTRKHVIPLLEYLDGRRVTRRAGAHRVVL